MDVQSTTEGHSVFIHYMLDHVGSRHAGHVGHVIVEVFSPGTQRGLPSAWSCVMEVATTE